MSLLTTDIFHPKHFIEIDKVRITPALIEFKNGFPGRNYKTKIKIQNFSATKAFVRITPPSSYAFKIKAIPRGTELSPGLSIVRTLCFTYTYMSVQLTFLPVYVNDKLFNIEINVEQPTPEIKFFPESLNFGTIDAGYSSTVRTLQLKNIGGKASRFYVDLTTNWHQILVDPNNGLLQPNTEIELRLRLMGTKEGPQDLTLWIKCDNPFCVPLTGTVIIPKFEAIHPNATERFTVLEFPMTYIGAKCSQTILIRNYSQSGAMFCVLGEVKTKSVSYEEAGEYNPHFNCFAVYPREGSFEPNETKIFHFTFSPTVPNAGEKILDYYLCVYKVTKIRAKYMKSSDYRVSKEHYDQPSFSTHSFEYEAHEPNNFVRIYVHATSEMAKVTVVPDQLHLTNLVMNRKELRVLEFTNNSNKLPIILRYKKVMYITMEKPSLFLKPSEVLQAVVAISSQKIGVVKSQIDFDLLLYDSPKMDDEYKVVGYLSVPIVFETSSITKNPPPKFNPGMVPKYIKEVGMFCNDIKFNSVIEKPKTAIVDARKLKVKDDLIAFPNDMQRSIRPWRNKNQCTTIFTDIPRYTPPCNEDYELTVFDREFKIEVTKYYNNYTRNEAKRLIAELNKLAKPKLQREYRLTDLKLRYCMDIPREKILPIKLLKDSKSEYFLPLSPAEMNKIIVTPETVHTGEIAAHHPYRFTVHITNDNAFPIRIVIKPENPVLMFPNGNRLIIGTKCITDVNMVYMSSSVGYYSVAIDFIVNESMVIQVTLLANVAPKSLQLSSQTLEFQELESQKYIDLYNPFNTHVNFFWTVHDQNIIIKPDRGCVQANKYLTCIAYLAHVMKPALSEIELNSGEKMQLVKVIVKKSIKLLLFPTKRINLHNLPLNMPVTTEVIIQNNDIFPQSFTILNPEPIPGVAMSPMCGKVQGNSEWVCYIHVQLTSCIHFTCIIKVEIEKSISTELLVEGTVIFPEISVIPKQIIFQKNPSSYFDVKKFTIENKSSAIASVKIDMTIYPEFTISESQCAWSRTIINEIILDGCRSKTLFLHYKPMYVASGSFYLPIIVNNMLGPPISTDLITTKVSYFMNISDPLAMLSPMKNKICCVKVQSYSTEPKLSFSKSSLYFQYNLSSNSFSDNLIKISNSQKDSEEFCIRTDDLTCYFTLCHSTGKEIRVYDGSIVCKLDPTEYVELKVSFNPIEFGDFHAVLPVYLKSDMSTKMHKYISLRATYPQPVITYDNPPIYMTAIPLKTTFSRNVTLQMKNHKVNCTVVQFTDLEGLSVIQNENNAEKNETEYKISYTLRYIAEKSCIFKTILVFKCSCGSKFELPIIGCAENCFLTNYGFSEYYSHVIYCEPLSSTNLSLDVQSVKELSNLSPSYPSFYDTKNFIHQNYMTAMLNATEFWISKQVFFGKSFYKIPDGFINVKFNTGTICVPPFAKLLINLVGPQITTLLNLRNPPKRSIDRNLYVHSVYEKALDYLKSLGAYCPQIQCEHLLGYPSYKLYTQYNTHFDISKIVPEEDFVLLSTQTWLDLILQTYKVLILYRLNISPTTTQCADIKEFPMQKFRSVSKESRFDNVFSDVEITLLQWLEFHFNDMKAKIWEDNIPRDKEINNFSQNLSDSLVFAAVTAAYCPYLIKHFKTLYVEPSSYEENLHNAIKVTQAWDLINFSFNVSPTEIVDSNSIHILFLVSYLYVVLPTLYPLEVIKFNVGLSLKQSKSLTLINKNSFVIRYEAIFFNNDDSCFNVKESKLILEKCTKAKLSIQYHARIIKNLEVVLLLSGECPGFRYAKSKAVTLLGEPDITYFTSTMTIPVYLYNIYEMQLQCKSPYDVQGYYKLQMTYDLPENVECLIKMPYITDTPKITVNRITFTKKDLLFFDENGNGIFDILVCALNPFDRNMYLYFTNKDIGAFAIQIRGVVNNSYDGETIDVAIPINFSVVTIRSNILNMAYVHIPCQNRSFWDTTKAFILRMVDGDEFEFWMKYIYTPMGIHVLREMLAENNILCMKNICQKNKQYKLIVPRNVCATLPQHITIEDECSTNHISIPITFKSTSFKNFSFIIESCDGLIRRIISINFI